MTPQEEIINKMHYMMWLFSTHQIPEDEYRSMIAIYQQVLIEIALTEEEGAWDLGDDTLADQDEYNIIYLSNTSFRSNQYLNLLHPSKKLTI